jgi:hypothetical protein
MRARAAYISSLGTTAILVAAAVLMLAVVSALVAFKGWPGSAARSDVDAVTLAPRAASAEPVKVDRARPARVRVSRGTGAAGADSARGSESVRTAGLVKTVGGGNGTVVPGLRMVPATPNAPDPAPAPPGPVPTGPTTPDAPDQPTSPLQPPADDPLAPVEEVVDGLPTPPDDAILPGSGEPLQPGTVLVTVGDLPESLPGTLIGGATTVLTRR